MYISTGRCTHVNQDKIAFISVIQGNHLGKNLDDVNAYLRVSYNTLVSLCVGGKRAVHLLNEIAIVRTPSSFVIMQKSRKSMVHNLTRP